LDEYFKIRRIYDASFSYDEKLVAFANDDGENMENRPNVWVMPITGGQARQITRVSGRLHSFAFSPTADQLVLEAAQAGEELPHLYLSNAAGDNPRDLCADYPAGRRTEFIGWEPDGKAFLFRSNLRDEKYNDLYEYNVKEGKAQILW